MRGIYQTHSKDCPKTGSCKCPWQARPYNKHTGQRPAKTFKTRGEASRWFRDYMTAVDKGHHRQAATRKTVAEACEEFLAGMADGSILSSKGRPFRPETVHSYKGHLRGRVSKRLGGYRLVELDQATIQRFVDQLVAEGEGDATIRNAFKILQGIFRRAVSRGECSVDPTKGVNIPARVPRRFRRVASPEEAEALIAALPESDHPIWAIAFYAGLRVGEIQGLTWDRVHLNDPRPYIVVDRQWVQETNSFGPVKTQAGNREVPILAALRPFIDRQRERTGGEGFVCPRETVRHQYPPDDQLREMVASMGPTRVGRMLGIPTSAVADRARHPERTREPGTLRRLRTGLPFNYTTVIVRAKAVWKRAGLEPIRMHDCRHTFVSILMAHGVDSAWVQYWAGHKHLSITQDIYTHRVPGRDALAIEEANEALPVATVARLPRPA